MGGRRSPPPPRTQRSHQGSRDWPDHPVLSSTPPHLPLPRGAAGFSPATGHSGARARGAVGAGPVSAVGASLGLCPGPGPVPTRGGPHAPGLVRVGARCHRGAAGRAVSQLSAQRGPSRPRDPPCPPLCFADPAACSCRLPRLVARFQPHSAYLSSSLHPTARVYPLRPALSLPAPQPPARQGLSSAEEGRHGTSLASSRHALASLSQAAARAPCVAGKLCHRWPLAPITPLAPRISQRMGGSSASPAHPGPVPLPVPAWLSAPSQSSIAPSQATAPHCPGQGLAHGLLCRSANSRARPCCPHG